MAGNSHGVNVYFQLLELFAGDESKSQTFRISVGDNQGPVQQPSTSHVDIDVNQTTEELQDEGGGESEEEGEEEEEEDEPVEDKGRCDDK